MDAFSKELCAIEPNLFRYARTLCHDRDAAADLVQDTFVKALHKRHQFDSDTILRKWCMRLMYTIFIDQCRRKTRERLEQYRTILLVEQQGRRPFAQQEVAVLAAQAKQIMDKRFSAGQITAFELMADGFSYDTIAKTLGIPHGTVRSRLARVRRVLQAGG